MPLEEFNSMDGVKNKRLNSSPVLVSHTPRIDLITSLFKTHFNTKHVDKFILEKSCRRSNRDAILKS